MNKIILERNNITINIVCDDFILYIAMRHLCLETQFRSIGRDSARRTVLLLITSGITPGAQMYRALQQPLYDRVVVVCAAKSKRLLQGVSITAPCFLDISAPLASIRHALKNIFALPSHDAPPGALSLAEIKILMLIERKKSVQSIARTLKLNEKTLYGHLSNIRKRYCVKNNIELIYKVNMLRDSRDISGLRWR